MKGIFEIVSKKNNTIGVRMTLNWNKIKSEWELGFAGGEQNFHQIEIHRSVNDNCVSTLDQNLPILYLSQWNIILCADEMSLLITAE